MSKKKIKKQHKHATPRTKRGLTQERIEQEIRQFFANEGDKVYNYKQVCRLFGQTTMREKRQVVQVLDALVVLGFLQEVELGRYRATSSGHKDNQQKLEGIFRYTRGIPTFIPEGESEELRLSERGAAHALDGDRVRVAMSAKRGRHHSSEYEVVKIIERSPRQYVGKIKQNRSGFFFTSESRELRAPLLIPREQALDKGIRQDDKVIARALSWSSRDRNPIGEVLEVLGQSGDNEAEMHAILAEYGLPYEYPQEVEQAADKLSGEITTEELRQREDFRSVLTLTIDPRDAKDFDDALSLRQLENGNWELGVHIADVSHYVRPGDIIDREAYRRATSVYLVDRTIPMLPERLCNLLCSLRPGEEKYAYSCIFELDAEAKVIATRITRSVILSDHRLTYEEAQDIIKGANSPLSPTICTLNNLAQQLRQRRLASGSIAFERDEVRFEIDETGKPLSVYIKQSLEAHQLVEEFMLLANKAVAERIGRKRGTAEPKPFVYRIHDEPDMEKLNQLSTFAQTLGYKFKVGATSQGVSSKLNKFLAETKDKPEGSKFATIAIRTMAKAKYSIDNIGHYGLGFKYYTHFTSPIRRYPDLMVHRLLTQYLFEGGKAANAEALEQASEHSSNMEALAAQAERASIRYKQVEYMSDFLGETFVGTISGLAEWGIYVELDESRCEGLVPMRELKGDFYDYDEKNYCLVGQRTKQRYSLGDKLRVRVLSANLDRKQLDYGLADD